MPEAASAQGQLLSWERFGNVPPTALLLAAMRSARISQLFPQHLADISAFLGASELHLPFKNQQARNVWPLLAGATGASWPGRAAAPPGTISKIRCRLFYSKPAFQSLAF